MQVTSTAVSTFAIARSVADSHVRSIDETSVVTKALVFTPDNSHRKRSTQILWSCCRRLYRREYPNRIWYAKGLRDKLSRKWREILRQWIPSIREISARPADSLTTATGFPTVTARHPFQEEIENPVRQVHPVIQTGLIHPPRARRFDCRASFRKGAVGYRPCQ